MYDNLRIILYTTSFVVVKTIFMIVGITCEKGIVPHRLPGRSVPYCASQIHLKQLLLDCHI